jgi:hypothetical protein
MRHAARSRTQSHASRPSGPLLGLLAALTGVAAYHGGALRATAVAAAKSSDAVTQSPLGAPVHAGGAHSKHMRIQEGSGPPPLGRSAQVLDVLAAPLRSPGD